MKRLALALALLTAAGCSTDGLLAPSGPAPALYTLTSAPIPSGGQRVSWDLLVDAPSAPAAIDTSRIAVVPGPNRIDYYAGVVWAERVPLMVQRLLVEAFDRSGRITAVGRNGAGLRADFVLASDLADFEVDAESRTVHLRLTARLIRLRDRAVTASRTFESQTPIAAGDFDSAISGFDSALHELVAQLVDWTLSQGSHS